MIAELLAELEEQLTACMRCGFCQAVCPLYAQTGRETDVARGKLALLRGLAEDLVRDPEEVRQRLERCLLCGSCAAGCPSGVRVLDIFLKARAIITSYLGLGPAQRLVLRGLLSRPRAMRRLLGGAPRWQGILTRPQSEVLDTACLRLVGPLSQRHLKRLARTPFHRQTPELDRRPGAGRPRVAFFVGCLIDRFYPQTGRAALKALAHHQVGVYLPPGQACCGLPALAAGDLKSFAALVAHNLPLFDPARFDYLVTACGSCAHALAELWPLMAERLPPGQREQVQALAGKVREISDLLVEVGLAGGNPPRASAPAQTVTYHDPCHLNKALGVSAQPRQVIAANPAYCLVEMSEPDWCCGLGGSFSLKHYQLSASIGRRKLANIQATGCRLVATSCPACMLQLSDMLSQAGEDIQVRHAVEIYAESLTNPA